MQLSQRLARFLWPPVSRGELRWGSSVEGESSQCGACNNSQIKGRWQPGRSFARELLHTLLERAHTVSMCPWQRCCIPSCLFWQKGVWPWPYCYGSSVLVDQFQAASSCHQFRWGLPLKGRLEQKDSGPWGVNLTWALRAAVVPDRKRSVHAMLSSSTSPLFFHHLRKGPIFSLSFYMSGVSGNNVEAASCSNFLTSTQAPGSA